MLKESRGQHPNTTHKLINFKTMITFNTDYNDNTDHELTIEQLNGVTGAKMWPNGHMMSKELEAWKPSGTEEERSRAILEGHKICREIDESYINMAGNRVSKSREINGRMMNRICTVTI